LTQDNDDEHNILYENYFGVLGICLFDENRI